VTDELITARNVAIAPKIQSHILNSVSKDKARRRVVDDINANRTGFERYFIIVVDPIFSSAQCGDGNQ
jgi:hypothetical protein